MARKPRTDQAAKPPPGAAPSPGNRPKFRPNTPKGTTFKKPPLELFTTTLWDYPSQHYASPRSALQGDPNYTGATPSWVVWQLLQRYTRPGETVLDPMCGSGTTLDVCADLGREGLGCDVNPTRPDIREADARDIPLPDESCHLVFLDPPYSTHVRYSDSPACIGRLDAGGRDRGRAYFDAMRLVIAEVARVLRPGRHAALYVSDSRRDAGGRPGGEFIPIGFELFAMLRERFEPVDIVAVVRRNAKLEAPGRRRRARETDALDRGFNYLFIMRKPERRPLSTPRPRR